MDSPYLVIGMLFLVLGALWLILDSATTAFIGVNTEKSNLVSLRVIAMSLMGIAIILAGTLAK